MSQRREMLPPGPVFADPSGQRRRLMRLLGVGGSMLLVGALILVGIGLFGGPDTPFSVFGTPRLVHPRTDGRPGGRAGDGASGQHASGRAGGRLSGRHSPARSAASSRSARPSSPAPNSSPTNKAGKTPPGRNRSREPHPSPSRRSN